MVWHAQPIAGKVALGYRDDRKHGQHCVILLASWVVAGHVWACARCALHSGCLKEFCAKWSAKFLVGGRSRQSWWPEQAVRSGCGGGGGVSTSLVHALTEQSAACMQPGAPSALKCQTSWHHRRRALTAAGGLSRRRAAGAEQAARSARAATVRRPRRGNAGSSSAEGTSLGECTSTGPVSDGSGGSGGSGSDEALVQVRGVLRRPASRCTLHRECGDLPR